MIAGFARIAGIESFSIQREIMAIVAIMPTVRQGSPSP
jgi:hypothetical protein